MNTTETKKRTITLTGRPPVRITDSDWPLIASAKGDSYRGNDYGRYRQALLQGECDEYALRMRQHADGRTLVYGVLDVAIAAWNAPAGGNSYRGGQLLHAGADIANAIRRVGDECSMPDAVIRECIADMPAEEL